MTNIDMLKYAAVKDLITLTELEVLMVKNAEKLAEEAALDTKKYPPGTPEFNNALFKHLQDKKKKHPFLGGKPFSAEEEKKYNYS